MVCDGMLLLNEMATNANANLRIDPAVGFVSPKTLLWLTAIASVDAPYGFLQATSWLLLQPLLLLLSCLPSACELRVKPSHRLSPTRLFSSLLLHLLVAEVLLETVVPLETGGTGVPTCSATTREAENEKVKLKLKVKAGVRRWLSECSVGVK
jgi:hypothetical protein